MLEHKILLAPLLMKLLVAFCQEPERGQWWGIETSVCVCECVCVCARAHTCAFAHAELLSHV